MKFIFTCGGTAGHINPALSIAAYAKSVDENCEILFIGKKGNMEEKDFEGLPEDLIPNWDYNFVNPFAPRDASAAVITACGMDELADHLPDCDKYKSIYKNASARLLEAVIDNCTKEIGVEYDGLISHVTHAYTLGHHSHDECAVYGDYFYLEALLRFKNPDWKMYW